MRCTRQPVEAARGWRYPGLMSGPPLESAETVQGDLPVQDENGVDLALVRASLALSPTERIARLQDMADFVEQVREAAARRKEK